MLNPDSHNECIHSIQNNQDLYLINIFLHTESIMMKGESYYNDINEHKNNAINKYNTMW